MHSTTRLDSVKRRLRASARVREERMALLCADVVEFTALTERLGDRAALDLMRSAAASIRCAGEAHRGRLVELRGDSFQIAFGSVRDAFHCALAIHHELGSASREGGECVAVRIAMHSGPVLTDGEGYFGRNLIVAYRLLGQASAGEIAVSEEALEELRVLGPWREGAASRTGAFQPKGMREKRLYSVFDAASPRLAPPSAPPRSRPPYRERARLATC